jgi:hypothetical protein
MVLNTWDSQNGCDRNSVELSRLENNMLGFYQRIDPYITFPTGGRMFSHVLKEFPLILDSQNLPVSKKYAVLFLIN